MQTRRAWLMRAVRGPCALLLALAGCGAPNSAPTTPPDVLLVTLDTVRADRIGAYGYPNARTPVMDRVAAEGVRFERAWTTAPHTTASHCSLMTGLYPATHQVRDNGLAALSDEYTTLAERFLEAGYTTAAFVGAVPVTSRYGLAQGFQTFSESFGTDRSGRRRNQRTAEEVNRSFRLWMESLAEPDAPLFVWVHYYDAHAPYAPPEGSEFAGQGYDGEIAYVDRQLGELLELFGGGRPSDNFVTVIVADHGESLGEHGEPFHGVLLYEGTTRIPLLMRAPGRLPERKTQQNLVSLVDLYPTVLGLAGLPQREQTQGHDLSELSYRWTAPGDDDRTAPTEGYSVALAHKGPGRIAIVETVYPWTEFGWSPLFAIRRGDSKWIQAPEAELYRLDDDPGESRNLAGAAGPDADLGPLLTRVVEGLEAEAGSAGRAVDPAALEKLRSLGYAGSSAHAASEARTYGLSGRNPREEIHNLRQFVQGRAYLQKGGDGCRKARGLFRSLLMSDPDNPSYLIRSAMVSECLGDLSAAEGLLRSLQARFPDMLAIYTEMASLLGRQERWDDLIEFLESARQSDVRLPYLRHLLAQACLDAGRTDRAIREARAALESSPSDPVLRLIVARAHRDRGEDRPARELFVQLATENPTDARAWEPAVDLYVKSGDREEAVAFLQNLLKLAPGDPDLNAARVRLGGEQ